MSEVLRDAQCTDEMLRRITGKIEHYSVMFQDSRWYRQPLHELEKTERKPWETVRLPEGALDCLRYWLIMIDRAGQGKTRIPDVRTGFPSFFIDVATDAAGVSKTRDSWKGAGVYLEPGIWLSFEWPAWLRSSALGRSLSFLEGVAALVGTIIAMRNYPSVPIRIREDNMGIVHVYRKGSSSNPWVWTVGKAIFDLAKTRRTKVKFHKVGRRTSVADQVADHLSKGEWSKASSRVILRDRMEILPEVFWRWLEKPTVDPGLGWKIGSSW